MLRVQGLFHSLAKPSQHMLRIFFGLSCFALFALLLFEAYAVYAAERNLPDVISKYRGASAVTSGLTQAQFEIVVRVQDPSFRSHQGIEFPDALVTTTITQSLVKKLFFAHFRPGFQKIEQTLIAWLVVSPQVSKDVQLQAFASTAYFGHKAGQAVVGFREGALAWFDKPIEALSEDEFVTLVAMLPGPNALRPNSLESAERVNRIKRLLAGGCAHTRVSEIWLEQCKT